MNEFRPTRFEILPVVIKNLLIINALVFLAANTVTNINVINIAEACPNPVHPQSWVVKLLALHHIKSELFQPWQLFTYMFLHEDFTHILANMFGMWMFGSILENIWGPKRFLLFYVLCGLGAGLVELGHLWIVNHDYINLFVNHPASLSPEDYDSLRSYLCKSLNVPTYGASGAVFGILAAFIYLFPNTYIYLYFFVPIKAKWIGVIYIGYEIFQAIRKDPMDPVAHWAHLGGAVVGFLLVLTWNKRNSKQVY